MHTTMIGHDINNIQAHMHSSTYRLPAITLLICMIISSTPSTTDAHATQTARIVTENT